MAEVRPRDFVAGGCDDCGLHQVLGDIAHPGGLELTKRLTELVLLKPGTMVMDIGAGRGTTAIYLARKYRCIVTAIDLSATMVVLAGDKAKKEHLGDQVSFLIADSRKLPFLPHSFDVVISECSLSLLPDKDNVVRDIWRVLKPGGGLAFTDLIIKNGILPNLTTETALLPQKMPTLPHCISNAIPADGYIKLLKKLGFQNLYVEDHSHELKEECFRIGLRFGDIERLLLRSANYSTAPGKMIGIKAYQEYMEQGNLGYVLIGATK